MRNGHIMKLQVNILAREVYLEFVPMDLDSDETTRGIDTAVLDRISIRIIWAEWFGLGSHFQKSTQIQTKVFFFQNMHVHFSRNRFPKWVFPHATTGSYLGWSFSISRFTSYTRMAGPSVFPDTWVIPKIVGFSVFPDSRTHKMTDDSNWHLFHIIFTFISHIVHILGPNSNSSLLNTKDPLMHTLRQTLLVTMSPRLCAVDTLLSTVSWCDRGVHGDHWRFQNLQPQVRQIGPPKGIEVRNFI